MITLGWLVAAAALAKPANPPKPFECSGRYRNLTCTATFSLNDCKDSITLRWPPLDFPGSLEWARKQRNWCTIIYDGRGAREEKKIPPQECEATLKLMAGAFEGFPEVKWQDSNCNVMTEPDAILHVSHRWQKPSSPLHDVPSQKVVEPEPVAVRLQDARTCVLEVNLKTKVVGKRYRVLCPVLPQRVFSWMRKFLAKLDVGLVVRNSER